MKKIVTTIAAAIAALLTIAATNAYAAGTLFDGEGSARIEGPDINPARRDALNSALRRSVEEAAGSLLPVKIFVEKWETLDTRILKNAKNYVGAYTVILETREADSYRVMLQATIKLDLLKRDMISAGLLLPDAKIPKWMVVAPDRDGAGQWRSRWFDGHGGISATEAAAEELVREYGYRIAVPDPKGKGMSDAKLANFLSFAESSDATTTEIPKELLLDAATSGATHLLLAKGQTNSAEGLTGPDYFLGTATVKIALIDISAAKVLFVVTEKTAVETIGKAGLDGRALRMGVKKGRDGIFKAFDSVNPYGEQAGFAVLTVELSGVNAFEQYLAIKKALEKEFRGVRAVVIKTLMPGKVTIEVRYAGDAAKLMQELLKYPFTTFTLKDDGFVDGVYRVIIK